MGTTLPAVISQNSDHLGHTSEGFVWALEKYFKVIDRQIEFSVLIIAVLGTLFLWRHSYRKFIIVAVFCIVYVLFISALNKWWGRWIITLYPFLFVLFAIGLDTLKDGFEGLYKRFKLPGNANVGAISLVLLIIFGGVTLTQNMISIAPVQEAYRNGDTRIPASRWVNKNIEKGSPILVERYTAFLSSTDYDVYSIRRRRTEFSMADKNPQELYFDTTVPTITILGFHKNIQKEICDRNIRYVVSNIDYWIRYEKAGKYEEEVARYAAFQKLAIVEAKFGTTEKKPMQGPALVVYNTSRFCAAENFEVIEGAKPELNFDKL